MNFLSYVRKKKDSLAESPFNVVDALMLSYLCYTDFPCNRFFVNSLCEYQRMEGYDTIEPHRDSFLPKKSLELLKTLSASPRFKDIKILDQEKQKDKDKKVEFKATCFDFNDFLVIGFEGTTPSYIGWEEDFALSFQEEIASYPLAIDFVKGFLKKTNKDIVLLGHSKGGHLAAYCLYALSDEPRIRSCYSFEGPGFRDKKITEFLKQETRYTKFVPSSSIVGMLFSNEEEMRIVRSNNVSFFQHNPLEWVIRDDDFIYLKKRSYSSISLDKSINGWINSISLEERERFSSILFGALHSFEVQDFTTFFKKLPAQIRPARIAFKRLSKEDRDFFAKVLHSLARHLSNPNRTDF